MPADTPTLLQDGLKTEDPESLYPGFFQIDYILCRSRSTSSLVDARSYAGAKLQSDDKIVKASFDLGKRYKFYSTAKHSVKQYNTNSLVCSKEVQSSFQQNAAQKIETDTSAQSVTESFNNLFEAVKTAASETVGMKRSTAKRHRTSDPQVVSMSEKRHQLLQQLNDNKIRDRTILRKKIYKLKNDTSKRLSALETLKPLMLIF